MRILIYTGKGGVGKTTITAATALHLAKMGKKTLVMSTDQAHSLGDALALSLSGEAKEVRHGLDALELDTNLESRRVFGEGHDYLRRIISERANDGLAADEALLFPGMEELFCLLRVLDFYEEDQYDVLIMDCAPTGETLSLLRYPERLSVLFDKLLPPLRSITRAFGDMITRKTTVPKPRDEVFAELDRLVKRLTRLRGILCDRDLTSIRLIMTPERIVLDESRRSYAWMQLFDFGVDAVYINKIYPKEALSGYFSGWIKMQEESIRIAHESFFHQRLFMLKLQDQEIRGKEALEAIARSIYQDEDPARIYCREDAFRIEDERGTRKLILHLPFLRKEDIFVAREGGDLILRARNEVRRFHLPERLSRRYISGWNYENDELCVRMDYD